MFRGAPSQVLRKWRFSENGRRRKSTKFSPAGVEQAVRMDPYRSTARARSGANSSVGCRRGSPQHRAADTSSNACAEVSTARSCVPPSAIRAWPVRPTASSGSSVSSGRSSCVAAIPEYVSFPARAHLRGLRHGRLCPAHYGLARVAQRTDFVLDTLEQGVARAPAYQSQQSHSPCDKGS